MRHQDLWGDGTILLTHFTDQDGKQRIIGVIEARADSWAYVDKERTACIEVISGTLNINGVDYFEGGDVCNIAAGEVANIVAPVRSSFIIIHQ